MHHSGIDIFAKSILLVASARLKSKPFSARPNQDIITALTVGPSNYIERHCDGSYLFYDTMVVLATTLYLDNHHPIGILFSLS